MAAVYNGNVNPYSSLSNPLLSQSAAPSAESVSLGELPVPDPDQFKYVTVSRPLLQVHPDCIICTENFQLHAVNTVVDHGNEGHLFHAKCIIQHLKINPTCPVCRLPITSVNGVAISLCDASREAIRINAEQHLQALARSSTSRGVQKIVERIERVVYRAPPNPLPADLQLNPSSGKARKILLLSLGGGVAGAGLCAFAGTLAGAGKIFDLTPGEGALFGTVQGSVTGFASGVGILLCTTYGDGRLSPKAYAIAITLSGVILPFFLGVSATWGASMHHDATLNYGQALALGTANAGILFGPALPPLPILFAVNRRGGQQETSDYLFLNGITLLSTAFFSGSGAVLAEATQNVWNLAAEQGAFLGGVQGAATSCTFTALFLLTVLFDQNHQLNPCLKLAFIISWIVLPFFAGSAALWGVAQGEPDLSIDYPEALGFSGGNLGLLLGAAVAGGLGYVGVKKCRVS